MEAARLILSLAATWAAIGLVIYLWDILRMALAWMVLAQGGSTRRKAIVLATIAVEAAITGPLYALLRSDWFRRSS